MVATNNDRTFAEVRPLYEAWAVATAEPDIAPIEWAFRHAAIPIRYVRNLTHAHGFACDAHAIALAMLPAELEHGTTADRARALRACVGHWEEDGQYEACSRVWRALVAYVRAGLDL